MGGRWWTDVSAGGAGCAEGQWGSSSGMQLPSFVTHSQCGVASRPCSSLPPAHPPALPADAPFCKHIFVPNWTGAPVSALPITDDNKHLLQSGAPAGMGVGW